MDIKYPRILSPRAIIFFNCLFTLVFAWVLYALQPAEEQHSMIFLTWVGVIIISWTFIEEGYF